MSSSIEQAVEVLRNGGVVAYPTEAVYGLGCDPDNSRAIEKILALKQRERNKGLILIASEVGQVAPYLDELPEEARHRVLASWPGPFTWLWPAKADTSEWLRGDFTTLAVRVTAHPQVRELCQAFGKPLVSTSANLSGQPPARTAAQVREQFGQQVDFVLEGEVGPHSSPTEIRDALSGELIRG
ncbi:L-threonylcarbamoyladenylate synthase [Thiohalophilus sp.]|uniref:L-threonylcarbamoyladenylate synthase n=1 Tax=Thiohalophilus sp. TaxID=3028392 RepID=UPI002ACEF1D5|nr:L-threonylcarbamoyladenylate synthase [Thiohalophilus sp.]MDZ7803284.1 L-threonylcarbamoyladenylate synthase [Thiohalophilus sp.]